MSEAPVTIYNASAGSGKTHTLVKEFIKKIILSRHPDAYRHLLAITFTNKAVAEMKQRIVDHLWQFSRESVLAAPPPMFVELARETGLRHEQIQERSKDGLHHILHHFAALSVETIDGFNHRLIRTFARDLKIASNFEVSLEEKELLDKAVNDLIDQAGEDKSITQALIDFTIRKTDDDRSWDIARDIAATAQIIFNENDLPAVRKLKGKSLGEFRTLSTSLQKQLAETATEIERLADAVLEKIESSGLTFEDFNRKYLPSYFEKLASGNLSVSYGLKWQESLSEKPLYPSRVAKETPYLVDVLEELTPEFISAFEDSRNLVMKYRLIQNILKNLNPLSVINLVRESLDTIKEEENIVPISEFNRMINAEIRDQPAPFIYERLGERYRHFFIDEFQDTSLLQWENLVPLIDNAISQESHDTERGSLLLVGDAKQSIYRWRGGLPEQFISLYHGNVPFANNQLRVENLSTNWRSYDQIIDFNNSFFNHIAQYFTNPQHANLYREGNEQDSNTKRGGYVRLEWVDAADAEESSRANSQAILESINELLKDGFSLSEICILTRTLKEGVDISTSLLDHGIPVISQETLLLKHSDVVTFLVDCLLLREQSESDEILTRLLLFLFDHLSPMDDKHLFLSKFLPSAEKDFTALLKEFGIEFSMAKIQALPIYEALEYSIKAFSLMNKPDAYVDGFLNLVFDFQQRTIFRSESFSDFWELQKEKASITTPQGVDAVQLLTIHKSKGLEFQVVLFPHADVRIYRELDAKAWIDGSVVDSNLETLRIDFKEEVRSYGDFGESLYEERRSKLQLDNVNILYVALTRAVERLYIYSTKTAPAKDGVPDSFNRFFRDYLETIGKWDDGQSVYEFGNRTRIAEETSPVEQQHIAPQYHTTFPEEHNLRVASKDASLWFAGADLAIDEGTLLHEAMARIKNVGDLDETLQYYQALLPPEALKSLELKIKAIVKHPDLSTYFNTSERIENERDIVTQTGAILRPDRVHIHEDGSFTVIDYKTGSEKTQYSSQIHQYAEAMSDMGFNLRNTLIIYVADDGISINKN